MIFCCFRGLISSHRPYTQLWTGKFFTHRPIHAEWRELTTAVLRAGIPTQTSTKWIPLTDETNVESR